jgi:CheY-like chemotaxis protein
MFSMLKKILLIDDEPDVLYVSRVSLSSVGGWSVISTHDATEALMLAKKEKPNLILLDVVMGPINGLDIFLELQRDAETTLIPVILLTVRPYDTDVRRVGARGIIAKPFDPMKLSEQIERILQET